MSQSDSPRPARPERRASRRVSTRGAVRVECRKGSQGLGPNLTVVPLDVSENGLRVVLKAALPAGQEVEVQLHGGGLPRPVKRLARVIWSVPVEGGHCAGLRFDGCVPYADVQALAMPVRVLR